jgi:hypothetical protein
MKEKTSSQVIIQDRFWTKLCHIVGSLTRILSSSLKEEEDEKEEV